MPVRSITRFPAFAWIVPDYHPQYKITITPSGGSETDITGDTVLGEFNFLATDGIGDFRIETINSGTYTGLYTGNETIKYYKDYATTATTLRFKGIVEKVEYSRTGGIPKLILKGRNYALKIFGKTVTKSYIDALCSTIITDLINSYGNGEFTTTNVSASTTTLSVSWSNKPFWDCIKEVCDASGFDAYIDSSDDFHFFESGSITNTTEAIIHDSNLIETSDFGYDSSQLRNRVIVYGQTLKDVPLFAMAEDTASQASLGRTQEYVVNDTNLTTLSEVQERAANELSLMSSSTNSGTITSILLVGLNPGELLRISDPDSGISPSAYRVIDFKDKIDLLSDSTMETIVSINVHDISIPSLFKSRIAAEQKQSNILNPYEMNYSYPFYFADTTQQESATNMLISDGKLSLISDGTGQWTSTTYITPINITQYELKASIEGTGTVIEVSTNNGYSWTAISGDILMNNPFPGNQLKIRISMNSESQAVNAMSFLYK